MLVWTMTLALAGAGGSESDRPSREPTESAGATRIDFRKIFSWLMPRRTPRPLPNKSVEPNSATPSSDRPSDGVLQVRVQNEVFENRELRMSPMRVEVRNGIAILRGEVDSVRLADEATQRAGRTHGIVGVRNELRLGHGEALGANRQMLLSSPKPMDRPRGKILPVANVGPDSISVVSRPKVLISENDLPDVTTYTIRRSRTTPEVDSPKQNPTRDQRDENALGHEATTKPERAKRPGLVRLTEWESAGAAVAPIATELPTVPSQETDVPGLSLAQAIEGIISKTGLRFRELHGQVTLFGRVSNYQILFQTIERINALPGIHSVVVDRARTKIGE